MYSDIYNCCKLLLLTMASIAIMAGGALLNAVAFIGGNYLACFLSGEDSIAALEEKVRHDKALESYQEAYSKCEKDRMKLLDWIAAERIKEQAKQNFTDTDYTFKLYNQVHPDKKASSKNKASPCSWALAPLRSVTQPFVFFELFITIPSYDGYQTHKGILQPRGYWKGIAAIKKLYKAAKASEDTAKKWLVKQALWQIYLPVPQRIS